MATATKKLMLTSRAKMGKAKKKAAPATTTNLKETLQAAVEQAVAQAPAVTGLDSDQAIDAASIGELVKPVQVPTRQITVTGADGKVHTAKASRSQSRRPARAVAPALKAEAEKVERAPLTERECAAAGDTWIGAKEGRLERYGVVEASSPVIEGKCTLTTTNFHLLEVDAITGKVKYLGVSPAREQVAPKAEKAAPEAKADHSDSLFALLSRPEGATAAELMTATGLSRSGVNAAVSRLIKARGLKLTTQKNPGMDPADRRNSAFLYFAA
jgi:hypothetical protein